MPRVEFQGHVQAKIKALVVAPDDRMDVEEALALALRKPQDGEKVRQSGDYAQLAVKIHGASTRPPLTFYYVYTGNLVLVVDVKVTGND